ncbi:MAG: hypothetical protein EPO65_08395 [Dehalococcoidia bacterium]|nr:MAG: hypothetical protein EPO65_08395 [Dehalococcoidia bacterium]
MPNLNCRRLTALDAPLVMHELRRYERVQLGVVVVKVGGGFLSLDIGALVLGLVTVALALYVLYRDSWRSAVPEMFLGYELALWSYGDARGLVAVVPVTLLNESAKGTIVHSFDVVVNDGQTQWIGYQGLSLALNGTSSYHREFPPAPRMLNRDGTTSLLLEIQVGRQGAVTITSKVRVGIVAHVEVPGSLGRHSRFESIARSEEFVGPPNSISDWFMSPQHGSLELRATHPTTEILRGGK